MRRPALIFDFGNVVAHFDYLKAADALGARLGISGRDLLDRLRPLGFSDLVRSYESGRISAEAFSSGVSGLVGLEISHGEFAAAWSDIFTANESIAPLIGELKARGYTLVLGSNTNDLHAERFLRQFAATLAHFDRPVLSHAIATLRASSPTWPRSVSTSRWPPDPKGAPTDSGRFGDTPRPVPLPQVGAAIDRTGARRWRGVMIRSRPRSEFFRDRTLELRSPIVYHGCAGLLIPIIRRTPAIVDRAATARVARGPAGVRTGRIAGKFAVATLTSHLQGPHSK